MRTWSTSLLAIGLVACADIQDAEDRAPQATPSEVEVLSPEEQAARKMAALPIEQQSEVVQRQYREARVRHLDQAIAAARATLNELQSQPALDELAVKLAEVKTRLSKLEIEKQKLELGKNL